MIASIKEPLQLAQLESLDLSNNFLKEIAVIVFRKLTALKSLDLCDNPFESLPDVSIFPITPTITKCPQDIFVGLEHVQWLHMSRTNLNLLTARHMVAMPQLQHLSLDACKLLYVQPFAFIGQLAFEFTRRTNIHTSPGSPQLQSIDLRRMNLTAIPEAVTQACTLSTVLLDFNYLYGLSYVKSIDVCKCYYMQVHTHFHQRSYCNSAP